MKLSLDEFKQLCSEVGFGLTFPEPDQERLHAALAKRLGWNRGNGADAVIAAYVTTWGARYGSSPAIDGRILGTAKALARDLGVEEAVRLVEAFLQMEDFYFKSRRHDLGALKVSLQTVKHFADTGRAITRQELTQDDRRQANVSAFSDLLKGGR